jgi:tetratricopeptide (TPR) repeat protein
VPGGNVASCHRAPWDFGTLALWHFGTLALWHLGTLLAVLTTGQDCQQSESLARAAYEERRYDQSAQQFTRAIQECGPSAPLILALGQAQLLAQKPAEAVATLDRIRTEDAEYIPALKVKARALYLLRRDREAEDTLKGAAARAPADAEVPYHLGRIYYQQARYAEAAGAFRRATTLDPRAYAAWDNLGLACEALGDTAQAQQHYLKSISLVYKDHPRYDVVYANFADLLIKLGEFQKAFDLAVEAAQRNPDEARNFFLGGKALLHLERSDVSVRWFEQAIKLNPDYPEPQYLLSLAYRRLGRIEDADRMLKLFQTAAARAPKERR